MVLRLSSPEVSGTVPPARQSHPVFLYGVDTFLDIVPGPACPVVKDRGDRLPLGHAIAVHDQFVVGIDQDRAPTAIDFQQCLGKISCASCRVTAIQMLFTPLSWSKHRRHVLAPDARIDPLGRRRQRHTSPNRNRAMSRMWMPRSWMMNRCVRREIWLARIDVVSRAERIRPRNGSDPAASWPRERPGSAPASGSSRAPSRHPPGAQRRPSRAPRRDFGERLLADDRQACAAASSTSGRCVATVVAMSTKSSARPPASPPRQYRGAHPEPLAGSRRRSLSVAERRIAPSPISRQPCRWFCAKKPQPISPPRTIVSLRAACCCSATLLKPPATGRPRRPR